MAQKNTERRKGTDYGHNDMQRFIFVVKKNIENIDISSSRLCPRKLTICWNKVKCKETKVLKSRVII